ncbi:MAG TPA: hypothetical protein VLG72_06610 [Nitrospirota bacterium]|nr:hypothetical protein [Nitrospirota bacterium]
MRIRRFKRIVTAAVALAAFIALALYVVPLARHRSENVAQGRQWASLLKKHPAFSAKPTAYPVEVAFAYAPPTDENLRKLRSTYDLDTVAGGGPETERLINLLRWVYQLTGHANEPAIPEERNALNLIPLARDRHMQINCYLKTVILNEVYLAMGFESRQTHLWPAENEDEESHYITSVYSRTLGRWILMDPDFGVYATDDQGAILGVAEIRSRLIAGRPVAVRTVDPPPDFLARVKSNVQDFVDGTSYLWYLQKNLFKIECPQNSLFNLAAVPNRVHIQLIPDGYREELLQAPGINARGNKVVYLNDEGLFWQKPVEIRKDQ